MVEHIYRTAVTITHWCSYEPTNMERDWVDATCGARMHIREYSSLPSCKERACQLGAMRHRLRLAKERQDERNRTT